MATPFSVNMESSRSFCRKADRNHPRDDKERVGSIDFVSKMQTIGPKIAISADCGVRGFVFKQAVQCNSGAAPSTTVSPAAGRITDPSTKM